MSAILVMMSVPSSDTQDTGDTCPVVVGGGGGIQQLIAKFINGPSLLFGRMTLCVDVCVTVVQALSCSDIPCIICKQGHLVFQNKSVIDCLNIEIAIIISLVLNILTHKHFFFLRLCLLK